MRFYDERAPRHPKGRLAQVLVELHRNSVADADAAIRVLLEPRRVSLRCNLDDAFLERLNLGHDDPLLDFRAMPLELGRGKCGASSPVAGIWIRLREGRERDCIEGQIMLGHRKTSTSDAYAPFDTGYLARALAVTEAIIEQIEKFTPGAFGSTCSVRQEQIDP